MPRSYPHPASRSGRARGAVAAGVEPPHNGPPRESPSLSSGFSAMADLPARQFVAFDLETTGLLAESDRVVEVGAVRFDATGLEVGRFERLINPGYPMPTAAQAVHGLGDADLAGAPPAREVLPEFLEFLGDPTESTVLAHNGSFDARFLGRELGRAGLDAPPHTVVDTLALARHRLPQLPSHR